MCEAKCDRHKYVISFVKKRTTTTFVPPKQFYSWTTVMDIATEKKLSNVYTNTFNDFPFVRFHVRLSIIYAMNSQ